MNRQRGAGPLRHRGHAGGAPPPPPPLPPAEVPGIVEATSEDGRFVVFDVDAGGQPPEHPPWESWLTAAEAAGAAVSWTDAAPGRRRIRVVVIDEAVGRDAAHDRDDRNDRDGSEGTPLGLVRVASGRLCVAGLDQAFAARHAELHPGAFGDVLEIGGGTFAVTVSMIERPDGAAVREAVLRRVLRPHDRTVLRSVQGGVPFVIVVVAGLVAAAAGVLAVRGGAARGPAVWTIAAVAASVAAWIGLVRAGAMPALRRSAAARRATAEALPDVVLTLRRAAMDDPDAGGDGAGGVVGAPGFTPRATPAPTA